MSFFESIPVGKPLEVFSIGPAVRADTDPRATDLCIAGSYVTEEGSLWVFPVVQKVEKELQEISLNDKAYLPVLGLKEFTEASTRLVLGQDSKSFKDGRYVACQSLSGTGSLRIVAEFLARVVGLDTFYTARPTWENHHRIFFSGGFKHQREYPYWNASSRSLDFEGLIQSLKEAPLKSAIVLQAVAQNPTGVDPTKEQWEEIGRVCKERSLFPVFDCVRQGFVKDLDEDVWAIRYFADELGLDLAICQSYAKNFAFYNERVGNAVIVMQDKKNVEAIQSQVTLIVRGMYSNPPAHGARIAARILNNPGHFAELKDNLKTARDRVKEMREKLYEKLMELKTPGDWTHVKTQLGIFFYSGLTPEQVDFLRSKYHLYMFRTCHVNLCGLNQRNLDYVAGAIHAVVTGKN